MLKYNILTKSSFIYSSQLKSMKNKDNRFISREIWAWVYDTDFQYVQFKKMYLKCKLKCRIKEKTCCHRSFSLEKLKF